MRCGSVFPEPLIFGFGKRDENENENEDENENGARNAADRANGQADGRTLGVWCERGG